MVNYFHTPLPGETTSTHEADVVGRTTQVRRPQNRLEWICFGAGTGGPPVDPDPARGTLQELPVSSESIQDVPAPHFGGRDSMDFQH